MHYDILDMPRQELFPFFETFKEDFYLAGGTALALQLGHRDSIDFDFFTKHAVDTGHLEKRIQESLTGHSYVKVQEERGTLGLIVNKGVKLSFMEYAYPLVDGLLYDTSFTLASVRDIAAMKCSAITRRALEKDYIDLFFILKNIPLAQVLEDVRVKFPHLDQNLVLKSLTFFDDIESEPIRFTEGNEVSFDRVQESLKNSVKKLLI